ncbi:MAG: TetR family transcriptional regulator C-terminal domain-containing protein [Clostridia bacterium]|nr:TetR family transcriptional regulator C-terminal domain-containing protein [Clostridia bacterium]
MGRHAEQTKAAIMDAFLVAIEEKKVIDKVYVRDVANIGHFSRSTFYTYYDGIDDLTNALADKFGNEICDVIRAGLQEVEETGNTKAPYLRMLEYLIAPGNLSLTKTLLLDAHNQAVTEAIAEPIRELLYQEYRKNHPDVSEATHHRTSVFWVYGMYGLIKDWLRKGCDRDIEHIAESMAVSVHMCGDWKSRD